MFVGNIYKIGTGYLSAASAANISPILPRDVPATSRGNVSKSLNTFAGNILGTFVRMFREYQRDAHCCRSRLIDLEFCRTLSLYLKTPPLIAFCEKNVKISASNLAKISMVSFIFLKSYWYWDKIFPYKTFTNRRFRIFSSSLHTTS